MEEHHFSQPWNHIYSIHSHIYFEVIFKPVIFKTAVL